MPPGSTSGAFARSETGLQLAWALGGGLALLLPTVAAVGFAVAAGVPLLGVLAGARVAAGRSVLPRRARTTPDVEEPADTVVVRSERAGDRDDTVVVRLAEQDPDDTVVVRPARAGSRDDPVVVRAGRPDPDDTVVGAAEPAG